ncbi:MAG: condensation domain-containing protein [Pyrinomonadaceae bacterium]
MKSANLNAEIIMNNLTERIAALSPEQRALLDKRLQGNREKSLTLQIITRRPAGAFCPLSIDQEHLWFLDQVNPGSFTYNISASFHLAGPLNRTALEESFNEVVRRHESLRTTFSSVEGLPHQVIAPSLILELPRIDLRHVPEDERTEVLKQRLAREAQKPFSLSEGPLIRAVLFQVGEAEHRLLMTLHHIVTDRWSYALLWQELSVLYEAFSKGLPSPLAELPIQFADFALWQRQWLKGETLEARLSYWRKQLAGASFVLELPTDRPRPAIQSFRGTRQYRYQSGALWARLRAMCQQENVTLYMMLLTAFYVLLYKYTGQEDIIVGSPYANRARVETESLIGYLLNMLVLRVDMSGDPSVRELLGRVRETTTGAFANGELPFAKLVKELRPERNLSRNPIFQVSFVFVDYKKTAVGSPQLDQKMINTDSGSVVADLMCGVREHSERPTLLFEYNVDLFDAATITRMMIRYETLLESILSQPDGRLSTLEMLTEEEKEQQRKLIRTGE